MHGMVGNKLWHKACSAQLVPRDAHTEVYSRTYTVCGRPPGIIAHHPRAPPKKMGWARQPHPPWPRQTPFPNPPWPGQNECRNPRWPSPNL
eukprot:10390671-Lingulodinium_polyedra.AAC.1